MSCLRWNRQVKNGRPSLRLSGNASFLMNKNVEFVKNNVQKNFFTCHTGDFVIISTYEPLWEGLQTSGTPVVGQEIDGEYR